MSQGRMVQVSKVLKADSGQAWGRSVYVLQRYIEEQVP